MADSTLSDFADIVMGQSPPGETCNTAGNGLPLLNGPTEYGPHHPTPVQFTIDTRKRARRGDVLFCVRGSTTGRMNWADCEYAIGRGVAAIRHKKRPELQPFVRAVIEYGLPGLLAQATGSTFPNVSADQLASLWWPPLEESEQCAIAHILGTLDEKIELNRQMNETLEAMAQALFKSWFVDFDPVRAKAEGCDPGLPKPLADLFPDSFEESELGEIPKGWEVQRVGGIGSVVCGKTPPTQASEYYGDDVSFITIPDMHGRIFATATQKRLSYAGAESQAKKMLPVGAICVSCIATAGLVVITSEAAQTNQQINTVVPSEKDTTYFWFWSLKNLGDEIRAGGSGGSVLINMSTGRFAELRLLAGLARLRSTYHSIVTPIFGRILANEHESRTLADLRDTLLPKLISGELRVTHPKILAEAVQ